MKTYIEISFKSGVVKKMSHSEYSGFTYNTPNLPDVSKVKVIIVLEFHTFRYVIYERSS